MLREGIEYLYPECPDNSSGICEGTSTNNQKTKVSAEGIEPSTNGLKGRCSAIELRAQFGTERFYHAHCQWSISRDHAW